MNLRRLRQLSLFQRRFALLAVYALVALPWIVQGAARAMNSNANSPIDWVPSDFPPRRAYDHFRAAFGQGDVVVASWDGCTIGNERLDELARQLREDPAFQDPKGKSYFESVVTGRELVLQLVAPPLSLPLASVRERLKGSFLGVDGETTCVSLTFTEAGLERRSALVDQFQQVLERICSVPRNRQHLAGPVMDGLAVDRASKRTLDQLAIPSALLVFALCHLALGSLPSAILVFGISLYAQGLTLAAVHYGGREMSALLIVMPPLIQVLAVAGGIHLVNYYREACRDPTVACPALHALRMGWLPCTLSAGTTAVGLGSLMVSRLTPIRDFGIFAALGVIATTALLLSFVPGTLSLRRDRPRQLAGTRADAAWDRFWQGYVQLIRVGHIPIAIGCVALLGGAAWGLTRLSTSVRIETLFPSSSRILSDYRWIEDRVGPLVPIEVILTCDSDCPLELSERLELVETLERHLGDVAAPLATEAVGKSSRGPPQADGVRLASLSACSFLPPPPARPTGPRLPHDAVLRYERQYESQLSSLLPLFRQLGYLSDEAGAQHWRITTFVSALSNVDYGTYLGQLRELTAPILRSADGRPRPGISLEYTGIMPLVHEIQRQLMHDLLESFLVAFAVIGLIMAVVQGHPLTAAVSMIPNLLPTVLLFGGLGWLGTPMDIGTVMTASVALGIAVDDTLHYLTFFQRGLDQGQRRFEAVVFASQHCGRAMVQSTVILALGISVFGLSDFVPTRRFAWMMMGSLSAALAGDLLLLPALLLGPLGAFFRAADDAPPIRDTRPSSVDDAVSGERESSGSRRHRLRRVVPRRSL